MANKCAVIIMEDNESCTVKTVNKSTYEKIQNMIEDEFSEAEIVESVPELCTVEENIIVSEVPMSDAIDAALDISEDYIILEAN